MKKFFSIAAILIGLTAFEGCYTSRGVYYERRPRPVVVMPGYYRAAPVIVRSYGNRGYYGGGRRRIYRRGEMRY